MESTGSYRWRHVIALQISLWGIDYDTTAPDSAVMQHVIRCWPVAVVDMLRKIVRHRGNSTVRRIKWISVFASSIWFLPFLKATISESWVEMQDNLGGVIIEHNRVGAQAFTVLVAHLPTVRRKEAKTCLHPGKAPILWHRLNVRVQLER